jgi:hypothetical protein
MRLTIKNIRKIEAEHSHLPALKLTLMTDKMYHFDCRWGDRDWSIVLGRTKNLNARYALIVRSNVTHFTTRELGLGILSSENYVRYSVKDMIEELSKNFI